MDSVEVAGQLPKKAVREVGLTPRLTRIHIQERSTGKELEREEEREPEETAMTAMNAMKKVEED